MDIKELMFLLENSTEVEFYSEDKLIQSISAYSVLEAIQVYEEAIDTLQSQSDEYDGYIACAVIRQDGMPMVVGELFDDIDELIEWHYEVTE